MVQQLLEEVKSAPVDESGRKRLARVLHTSISELKDGLAPELDEELARLIHPFEEETPSESELRIAQAQLVGWLEGLFHGIQTAIYAQQMSARSQLEQMRRALPPGAMPGMGPDQQQGEDAPRVRLTGRDVPLRRQAAPAGRTGREQVAGRVSRSSRRSRCWERRCGRSGTAAASSRPLAHAARGCGTHSAWGSAHARHRPWAGRHRSAGSTRAVRRAAWSSASPSCEPRAATTTPS